MGIPTTGTAEQISEEDKCLYCKFFEKNDIVNAKILYFNAKNRHQVAMMSGIGEEYARKNLLNAYIKMLDAENNFRKDIRNAGLKQNISLHSVNTWYYEKINNTSKKNDID